MSATRPDSTIKIYKVKEFSTRQGRPPVFKSPLDRETFMGAKMVASDVKCVVVKRRFQTLRVTAPLATVETATHISFINPSYGNKIFYGEIITCDYINNNVTQIDYMIDWWMTDMFNAEFHANTRLVRESLTNKEYDMLFSNPYCAAYSEKMRTAEPVLPCDASTEENHYKVMCDNAKDSTLGSPAGSYDGWNVFTNTTRLGKTAGTDDNTDTADRNTIYTICFVVPGKTQTGGNQFFTDINPILQEIETEDTGQTSGGALQYYKFFMLFSPTADYRYDYSQQTNRVVRYESRIDRSQSSWNKLIDKYPYDTKYPRPYMVVGTENFKSFQKLVDFLNGYGMTSSILGAFGMPAYILEEFDSNVRTTDANKTTFGTNNQFTNFLPTPWMHMSHLKHNDDTHADDYIEGTSPKLWYHPFTYYTIDGVDGTSHIEERFEDSQAGESSSDTPTNYIEIKKLVTIDATGITLAVAPSKSRVTKRGLVHGSYLSTEYNTCNLDNTAIYRDFPQIPYITDAFAAFLAEASVAGARGNTGFYKASLEQAEGQAKSQSGILGYLRGLFGATSGDSGPAGGVTSNGTTITETGEGPGIGTIHGVQYGMGKVAQGMNAGQAAGAAEYRAAEAAAKMRYQNAAVEGVGYYDSGLLEGHPLYDFYKDTRTGYIQPNYHAANPGGVVNLLALTEYPGVNVMIHRRSDYYVTAFNRFFNEFGYATHQVKKPAIAEYLDQNNDGTEDACPAFLGVPGEDTTQIHVSGFYTQTDDIHVTNVSNKSAEFIQRLFKLGAQFIKAVIVPQS